MAYQLHTLMCLFSTVFTRSAQTSFFFMCVIKQSVSKQYSFTLLPYFSFKRLSNIHASLSSYCPKLRYLHKLASSFLFLFHSFQFSVDFLKTILLCDNSVDTRWLFSVVTSLMSPYFLTFSHKTKLFISLKSSFPKSFLASFF